MFLLFTFLQLLLILFMFVVFLFLLLLFQPVSFRSAVQLFPVSASLVSVSQVPILTLSVSPVYEPPFSVLPLLVYVSPYPPCFFFCPLSVCTYFSCFCSFCTFPTVSVQPAPVSIPFATGPTLYILPVSFRPIFVPLVYIPLPVPHISVPSVHVVSAPVLPVPHISVPSNLASNILCLPLSLSPPSLSLSLCFFCFCTFYPIS